MTRIAAVAPVVPDYCYTQAEITAAVAPMLASDKSHRAVLERVHANSRIATRYTALPLERYSNLGSFTRTNEIFIENGRFHGKLIADSLRSKLQVQPL